MIYGRDTEPSRRIVFLDPDAAFADRKFPDRYWSSPYGKIEKFFKTKREFPKTQYPYESISRTANAGRGGPSFDRRLGEIMTKWDPEAVQRLAGFLRQEKAQFVLTSCDREAFGRDALAALFSYHDIDDLFLDMTVTPAPLFLRCLSRRAVEGPAPREYLSRYAAVMRDIWRAVNSQSGTVVPHRSVEIREYLDRHSEIEAYAVIDSQDLSSGIGRGRMVQCSEPFTEKNAEQLAACLTRADAVPRLPAACDSAKIDLFRRTSVSCLYRRWRDPMFSGTQSR